MMGSFIMGVSGIKRGGIVGVLQKQFMHNCMEENGHIVVINVPLPHMVRNYIITSLFHTIFVLCYTFYFFFL